MFFVSDARAHPAGADLRNAPLGMELLNLLMKSPLRAIAKDFGHKNDEGAEEMSAALATEAAPVELRRSSSSDLSFARRGEGAF